MKKEMQYNIIVAYEQMEDWESAKVKPAIRFSVLMIRSFVFAHRIR